MKAQRAARGGVEAGAATGAAGGLGLPRSVGVFPVQSEARSGPVHRENRIAETGGWFRRILGDESEALGDYGEGRENLMRLVSGVSRTKLRLRFMGTRAFFTPSTSKNSKSFSKY
ncbi:unnamed protein product [Amoebophrya sp. A120]|nr:unnamed protein product [Amoebophrya sp. A120]|eukprot:GSA120T00013176001.1